MCRFLTSLALNKKAQAQEPAQPGYYDYNNYIMTSKDRFIAFMIGALIAVVVMHVFFGSVIADAVVAVAAGIVLQPYYRNIMKNRIRNKLTAQFRDMLDSVNSSVSAGKVATKAFIDAQNDMKTQHGEDSYIYKELRIINIGVANGEIIENLLGDFGRRSGIEDIESFANVFAIANRRGGNMKDILNETKSILCDKIEIEQEIKTMVGATKNKLYIMMVMPIIIVPMISGLSDGGGSSVSDILVRIGALIAFIIAFLIGNKITDIKL